MRGNYSAHAIPHARPEDRGAFRRGFGLDHYNKGATQKIGARDWQAVTFATHPSSDWRNQPGTR